MRIRCCWQNLTARILFEVLVLFSLAATCNFNYFCKNCVHLHFVWFRRKISVRNTTLKWQVYFFTVSINFIMNGCYNHFRLSLLEGGMWKFFRAFLSFLNSQDANEIHRYAKTFLSPIDRVQEQKRCMLPSLCNRLLMFVADSEKCLDDYFLRWGLAKFLLFLVSCFWFPAFFSCRAPHIFLHSKPKVQWEKAKRHNIRWIAVCILQCQSHIRRERVN